MTAKRRGVLNVGEAMDSDPDNQHEQGASPRVRHQLAVEIAESRRVLEALAEKIGLSSTEEFETVVRPSVLSLHRDLRAMVIRLWHRVNSPTNWPGEMRGPIRVDELPMLTQGAMVEALAELEIHPRFEINTELPVPRLIDHDFPLGTALELGLGRAGSASFPLARLALALIPADHYLVLLVGWLVGRRCQGREWPKPQFVLANIGPLRAERWRSDEQEPFLLNMIDEFHSAVRAEVGERVRQLMGGGGEKGRQVTCLPQTSPEDLSGFPPSDRREEKQPASVNPD